MDPAPLTQFGIIVALAIGGQWLAYVLRLPSILILLTLGFLAGPMAGVIQPDILFGEALFPIVSFSVAVILFEGSLNLRLSELSSVRKSILSLTTIGLAVTWITSSILSWQLFGFAPEVSILFGAILIVTGPTVIVPMLREMSVQRKLKTVTIWEGIVNDPLGAVLCIASYEVVKSIGEQDPVIDGIQRLLLTLGVGALFAILAAFLITISISKKWMPKHLRNPIVLGFVLLTFVLAEQAFAEAGLVAVTILGVILANQNHANIEKIASFNQHLGIVLLSVLFILLSARFDWESFRTITTESYIFLATLILVIRPLSVVLATLPTDLNWREIGGLCFLAPRGIVAAAMSSLFAIKLAELGYPEARQIDSEIFFLISGTVLVYGLLSPVILKWLGMIDNSE